MEEMLSKKMVVLDGRTGEGGGQLVRIAACLSALTGTPIRIHNVRGNRGGGKNKSGGGGKQSPTITAVFCGFQLTEIQA
jgi:RNA 3'-terminal phosphate cyclase (ATP)